MQRLHARFCTVGTLITALGWLILLATSSPAVATQAPATAAPAGPPVMTSGVWQAGLLADGQLLCANFEGTFSLLNLDTGNVQPWQPQWDAKRDGWESAGSSFGWKLAVSPDGRHVALATAVSVTHKDPEGDYPDFAVAVLLCGPSGADARCVALAEVTDGGPQLDFTQDSARLVGPWYVPCTPTAAGLESYAASGYLAPDSARFNYVDVASGQGQQLAELPDYEYYLKAATSDSFVYENLDDPTLSFSSFADGGELGQWAPPAGRYWGFYQWVLPDALLVTLDDSSQRLVRVDGSSSAAPQPVWYCYASLPDGSCLFSDDLGHSVKYGKVDWSTFSVDWWVVRSDLARFAEPATEDGWPARINKWLPLRDASGAIVITPDTGDVVAMKLDRQGAKP